MNPASVFLMSIPLSTKTPYNPPYNPWDLETFSPFILDNHTHIYTNHIFSIEPSLFISKNGTPMTPLSLLVQHFSISNNKLQSLTNKNGSGKQSVLIISIDEHAHAHNTTRTGDTIIGDHKVNMTIDDHLFDDE